MKRVLSVCQYPEHWPEPRQSEDASCLAAFGLTLVWIGEFAWLCMEPRPGLRLLRRLL